MPRKSATYRMRTTLGHRHYHITARVAGDGIDSAPALC
jgi:hypothetical protein